MAKQLDLVVPQGDTFTRVIRWETAPYIYKAITAITQSAPVTITATAHGLKSGWRAAVVSARGMREINAENAPPRDSEYKQATVVDANNVTLNKVNSSDYDAYTSGGYLQFFTPVDLTGHTARMTIKNRVGGTVLQVLASPTDIVIDVSNQTITIILSATVTAGFVWTKGTYDLEMVSASGVVTKLYRGSITIAKEVTT